MEKEEVLVPPQEGGFWHVHETSPARRAAYRGAKLQGEARRSAYGTNFDAARSS